MGGASDDAALDAPSPLSPTHQLYLQTHAHLSPLCSLFSAHSGGIFESTVLSTCGSGGGAGGPGDGVRGGLIRWSGKPPFGCFTSFVSWCGGGGRGGPGLLKSM